MYNIPCKKCGGKGVIPYYRHINGGECFDCNGSGMQDVTKEEHDTYLENEKFRKQIGEKGNYVIYNTENDTVEYFKTEKDAVSKYGNFYCGSYGGYSCRVFYKHKQIKMNVYRGENDFINACRQQMIIDKQNKQKERIKILNEWLKKAIENKKHADEIQELKIMIKEAEHKLQVIGGKKVK
ncbi:hypothetical protein [Bacillus glycinifermentans]|uniref:hypothetical protein n=1 Tax=Bacillus glycinifermentans TaxID=1664069 RepID=UPI000BC35401|nr:hypothetical protein [Bacillus glycinifermentans]ATH91621.1 hypothetical protein COP00_02555 [Bacillus glycinifermentans]